MSNDAKSTNTNLRTPKAAAVAGILFSTPGDHDLLVATNRISVAANIGARDAEQKRHDDRLLRSISFRLLASRSYGS
jgi:hypothetical protein